MSVHHFVMVFRTVVDNLFLHRLQVEKANGGKRNVKMDGNFFTGYRKSVIAENEVLVSLFIPKTSNNQHIRAYKQAKRRDDDIAIVNVAINVKFIAGTNVLEDIQLAFGGMGPTTILAQKTAAKAVGKVWDQKFVELINDSLVDEISLPEDAPGGMVMYRRSLMLSLFFKGFLSITQELEKELNVNLVSERDRSGSTTFHYSIPKSSQLFEVTIHRPHSLLNLQKS